MSLGCDKHLRGGPADLGGGHLIVDGKAVELIGQEAVRACLSQWCCYSALPLPELKVLYEERWAAWEAEPPEWFTPAFQECVYDELVPAHVLEARIQARRAAAAAKDKGGALKNGFRHSQSKSVTRIGPAPPMVAWSQDDGEKEAERQPDGLV